ncbi:MAG: hypothetical protein Q7T33_06620 [Dehalococcoidia bacterium]|nr:hypothetical protein [Dehalococcoidia bacterium]
MRAPAMSILERLPIPKRLSARLWLITLPSAVVSFERRSSLPKLPIGRGRLLGIPLIAGGVALVIWSSRRGGHPSPEGPLSRLGPSPATAGGLIALGGVAVLLRSLALCLYSLGLALASNTNAIAVDEPGPGMLLGRGED